MGLLLMTACKPGVPGEYIQPDDMEDILYDYYVSQGIAAIPGNNRGNEDYMRDLYFNAVLKKHGVSKAEFDSSLVYYHTRADYFVKIFKNVQDRLSEDALNLGASEGEVERFTAQSVSGDTASVWEGDRSVMLIPHAPYNRYQFEQKADTSYHKGDSFIFMFKTDFLFQGGSKDALVYFCIKYENDSIASQTTHFSVNGNTQVRMNACDLKAKEVMGYFYLGEGHEKSADLRLLFLTNIQLVRIHHKTDENAQTKTKQDQPDSTKVASDSVRRASRHQFGMRPELEKKELN